MTTVIVCVAVVLMIAAFFLGRHFSSKPIENRNDEIRKERADLQEQITDLKIKKEKQEAEKRQQLIKLDNDMSLKQKDINNAEYKLKDIEKQYQDKIKVIENTEQLAQEKYEAKSKEYNRKLIDEENKYNQLKEQLNNEIDSIKEELNSLKATKAAAIEAARKEQEIHDNMDEYCLILPKEEERDIPLLREVQYKVSKPRAVAMAIWSGYYQGVAKSKFPKILGKQNVCGVYKITNQKTGECYIGQAVDVRTRWYNHAKAGLGVDTPQGNKLYNSMLEYGLDDFSFELLEECKPNELDEKEKYFIELYNSKVFGFNGTVGNNG